MNEFTVVTIAFIGGVFMGALIGITAADNITRKDVLLYGRILVDDQVYVCEPE